MASILYGISPIGLGHATRSLGIVRSLLGNGLEVRLVSGGKAVEFLRGEGMTVDDVIVDSVPRVVDGEMKDAFLWYARSWLAYRKTKSATRLIFDTFNPDLVVGDEEFSTLSIALERTVPGIMISDELELGFARNWLTARLEKRVLRWYKGLQSQASMLIVPEDGVDENNIRHVGPIVRPLTKQREEVFKEYGLPPGKTMVLLSLSGSGLGKHLLEKTRSALLRLRDPEAFLVAIGNRGPKMAGDRLYDLGVVSDSQNLVAAADVVVSLAGKSTIDEATYYGTPVIAIPLKNHAEQERNAAALGFSAEDRDNIPALVAERVGRRRLAQTSDGVRKAVDLIKSALPRQ